MRPSYTAKGRKNDIPEKCVAEGAAPHFSPLLFSAMLLLLCGCAGLEGRWTSTDTIVESAYAGLHVTDWGQTRNIAAHPDQFHEHNPVLGRHPGKSAVDAYFAGTLISHAAITYFLPRKYRKYWWALTSGLEIYCLQRNFRAGIGVRF